MTDAAAEGGFVLLDALLATVLAAFAGTTIIAIANAMLDRHGDELDRSVALVGSQSVLKQYVLLGATTAQQDELYRSIVVGESVAGAANLRNAAVIAEPLKAGAESCSSRLPRSCDMAVIGDGNDAGFSLVELLVAIAITSMVVLAIGGLLTLGVRVKDRGDEAMTVQIALMDVEALAGLADGEVGFALAKPTDDGFELERRDGLTWSMALAGEAVELRRGERISRALLSAFERVSLEYLAVTGKAGAWVEARRIGATTASIAVRLRLQRGERVWRPLMWIADSPAEVPQ